MAMAAGRHAAALAADGSRCVWLQRLEPPDAPRGTRQEHRHEHRLYSLSWIGRTGGKAGSGLRSFSSACCAGLDSGDVRRHPEEALRMAHWLLGQERFRLALRPDYGGNEPRDHRHRRWPARHHAPLMLVLMHINVKRPAYDAQQFS